MIRPLRDYIENDMVLYDTGKNDTGLVGFKNRLSKFPVRMRYEWAFLYVCPHKGYNGLDLHPFPPYVIDGVVPVEGAEEKVHIGGWDVSKTQAITKVDCHFDYLHVFHNPSPKFNLKIANKVADLNKVVKSKAHTLANLNDSIKRKQDALFHITNTLAAMKKGSYKSFFEMLQKMDEENPEYLNEFMSQFREEDVGNIRMALKEGWDEISDNGLRHPKNEREFRVIFDKYAYLMGYRILHYTTTFPDYILQKDSKIIRAEAEFRSHRFVQHGHNPNGCDLIVCWEDTLAGDNIGLDIFEFSTQKYIKANGEISKIEIPELPGLDG